MFRFFSTLLILQLLFFANSANAQTPGGINYQGVARNQYQTGLNNDSIQLRFTIKKTSPNGPVIYTETRGTRTDSFGVSNVVIGTVRAISKSGDIKAVPWSEASGKFLMVELNINPMFETFLNMGTTQLLSVPFSFYSDMSDSTRISDSTRGARISDSARAAVKADRATNAESAAYANASGKYFFSATMDPLGSQNIMPTNEDELESYLYDNRIKFPVVNFNEGNHYNPATSEFVAPEEGIYQFDFFLNKDMLESDESGFNQLFIALKKNGKNAIHTQVVGPSTYYATNSQFHMRLKLTAGDKVSINAANGNSNQILLSAAYAIDGNLNYFNSKYEMTSFIEFSGYKIK